MLGYRRRTATIFTYAFISISNEKGVFLYYGKYRPTTGCSLK